MHGLGVQEQRHSLEGLWRDGVGLGTPGPSSRPGTATGSSVAQGCWTLPREEDQAWVSTSTPLSKVTNLACLLRLGSSITPRVALGKMSAWSLRVFMITAVSSAGRAPGCAQTTWTSPRQDA